MGSPRFTRISKKWKRVVERVKKRRPMFLGDVKFWREHRDWYKESAQDHEERIPELIAKRKEDDSYGLAPKDEHHSSRMWISRSGRIFGLEGFVHSDKILKGYKRERAWGPIGLIRRVIAGPTVNYRWLRRKLRKRK
jgi:hypothetical protein